MDIKKLTHIPYRLFKARGSGLKKTPHDARDFNTGIFGWFGYKAKHKYKINDTLSVKDQGRLNTCQWNATVAQAEPHENSLLNVRVFVTKGNKMKLVSGDGYSNLRSGQKVLHEWGVPIKDVLKENVRNWREYVGFDPDVYTNRAREHRTGSFWSVTSRNDVLRLLDEGKILTTGIMWYTGFNQGGGFKHPWIIYKNIGLKVGGHAFIVIGYNMNYNGRKVYICQNSYSESWGDHGKFYIDMDYMDKVNYGFYTHLDDVDREVGNLLNQYDGKNVKGKGHPAIYHIQKGVKKPYPNWETFLAWNGKARGFHEVDKGVLDRVKEGDIMDIKKSDYWQFLRDVKEAKRLEALLELLNKEN